MHELYAADRERFYTRATLKEILAKGIDILSPAVLVQVFLEDARPARRPALEPAIEALYHQLKHTKGHLRLHIDHCRVLQRIKILVLFEVLYWRPDGLPRLNCRNLPDNDSDYWLWSEWDLPSNQILYLGADREDSNKVEKLKEMVEEDF